VYVRETEQNRRDREKEILMIINVLDRKTENRGKQHKEARKKTEQFFSFEL